MDPITIDTSRYEHRFVELCDRLKKMGYAESKHIRIYGQEFELISNPFPQGNGIAIQAVSTKEKQARTLHLPLPVLQMVSAKTSKKIA